MGCFSTLGLAVGAIALLVILKNIAWRDAMIPWALGVAALGVVVVNIRWRSMRVNLIYSLCLACRARRGRWFIYWFIPFVVTIALSTFVYPLMFLLLLPMYVLAERLQPAILRPARVL